MIVISGTIRKGPLTPHLSKAVSIERSNLEALTRSQACNIAALGALASPSACSSVGSRQQRHPPTGAALSGALGTQAPKMSPGPARRQNRLTVMLRCVSEVAVGGWGLLSIPKAHALHLRAARQGRPGAAAAAIYSPQNSARVPAKRAIRMRQILPWRSV